jgi:pimeloyl-ACP methyl ester carboxylesterase
MAKTKEINGTTVYINGKGKSTIIMVHGWPDTHEIWQKQVVFFEKHFTCVTFTLPGFGKNDTRNYTLDNITQLIKAIADEVSPDEQVILLLHDWGCIFGYEYAMKYPERIKKVVSIDVGDATSLELEKELNIPAKLMVFSYQMTLAVGWLTKLDFIHKMMAKGLKARSNFENIHAGMGMPYAMRWLGVNGGMNALTQIKPSFPFFYCYGLKKPFQFHSKKWLDKLRANPENHVQAFNCSHWVMVDKSSEFNEAVQAWLVK